MGWNDLSEEPMKPIQALFDPVTMVRGIDISAGIAKVYTDRAAAQGIPEMKMRAVAANLVSEEARSTIDKAEFCDFNLVAVASVVHHKQKPLLVLQHLVQRRKGGRVLLVVDGTRGFATEETPSCSGSQHGVVTPENKGQEGYMPGEQEEHRTETIVRDGFDEQEIKGLMSAARCPRVSYGPMRGSFRLGGKGQGK